MKKPYLPALMAGMIVDLFGARKVKGMRWMNRRSFFAEFTISILR